MPPENVIPIGPEAPEPNCPKCGDTGWILQRRKKGEGVEACDCRLDGRSTRIENRARIPPLYQNASFDNFDVPGTDNPTGRRELMDVSTAVEQFTRAFPCGNRPGLLLIGQPGSGKTHLAIAALR